MGNKQILAQNNETLATVLSNVLGLPSQESLKHGAYVWKKYECNVYDNPSFPATASTTAVKDLVISPTETLDITNTDKFPTSFFEGFYYDVSGEPFLQFHYDDNGLYLLRESDQSKSYFTDTISNGQRILVQQDNWYFGFSNTSEIRFYGEKIIVDYEKKSYVVSDSPTAYPDGGVQDGYWYEKVGEIDPTLFGCTKYAADKFTLSSLTNVYNGYTVNHSLGEVPKVIFLSTPEKITYGYRCIRRYIQFPVSAGLAYAVVTNNTAGGDDKYGAKVNGYGTPFNAPTNSQVTITEQLSKYEYLQSGIEYTLITMA